MKISKIVNKLLRKKEENIEELIEEPIEWGRKALNTLVDFIKENPEKINGFEWREYGNSSCDPDWTDYTICLLHNGKYCVEKRNPYQSKNDEPNQIYYNGGSVYNDSRIEWLNKYATEVFGGRKFEKYEVNEESGYNENQIARIILNPYGDVVFTDFKRELYIPVDKRDRIIRRIKENLDIDLEGKLD